MWRSSLLATSAKSTRATSSSAATRALSSFDAVPDLTNGIAAKATGAGAGASKRINRNFGTLFGAGGRSRFGGGCNCASCTAGATGGSSPASIIATPAVTAALKNLHVTGRFFSGQGEGSNGNHGSDGAPEVKSVRSRSNSLNAQGSIPELFDQNRAWSQNITKAEPDFFEVLSRQQSPKYLWIGCSDSRVPANEVVGLRPGELFVHRNVANVIVHTDLNALSVIQYAVEALRVEHIIVCGHYGCGGIRAALHRNRLGLIDNWLRHVQDIRTKHDMLVERAPGSDQVDLLCELNVVEQARNICETTIVQDAWSRGQSLQVNSWIYGLDNGLLKDLGLSVSRPDQLEPKYDAVVKHFNTTVV